MDLGLVLSSADDRFLSYDEMEIVEVVSDQVSVVLSRATVLEEFQTMREKLEMRNCVLQQANRMLCRWRFLPKMMEDVPTSLPNQVMGDEKRTFEVLLHMGGHLFNVSIRKGSIIFEVVLDIGADGGNGSSQSDSSISTIHFGGRRHNFKDVMEGLSFSMCKKLVQISCVGRHTLLEFCNVKKKLAQKTNSCVRQASLATNQEKLNTIVGILAFQIYLLGTVVFADPNYSMYDKQTLLEMFQLSLNLGTWN
ncbi:hypothetical protein H5410_055225 [Solanum commersonii]|uniref:Uncharacterized protein n=1 Tax=Solanum commersonii TaxID=4109 RepID=A0A9J5WH14_SOLCO|nr:hypothetical protein H5410_055225 [Solanum commersonii]